MRFPNSPPARPFRPFVLGLAGALALGLAGCGQSVTDPEETRELMDEAEQYLALYSFEQAYDAFSRARQALAPGSEEWIRATYFTATAGWHRTPGTDAYETEALDLLRELQETAPDSMYARRAPAIIGRILELEDYPGDPIELERAAEVYKAALDAIGKGEAAIHHHVIALRYGSLFSRYIGEDEKILRGCRFLEDWLERYPDNYYAAVMWEWLAMTYMVQLQDDARAYAAWKEVARIGFTNESRMGVSLQRMGELAMSLGKYEEAGIWFSRSIRDAPRSGVAWVSRQMMLEIEEKHPGTFDEIPPLVTFGQKVTREPILVPEAERIFLGKPLPEDG
ncbi:MAG: tetratricopeptide repeat protein [Opitutales bacterium]